MSALGSVSTSQLSSVGASLLATGRGPDAAAPAAGSTTTPSKYETEFANLKKYDEAELLYASFLSPADSLANTDAVLGQAAQQLAAPASTPSPAASTATPPVVPSVASVLAASDAAANKTIDAYVNAPAGSSILDYQA